MYLAILPTIKYRAVESSKLVDLEKTEKRVFIGPLRS